MIRLDSAQASAVRKRFPDRPGPNAGRHVINTGHGTVWADRWPEPRALLALTGSDYSLVGDPAALAPDELRALIAGFVDTPEAFVPLLRAAFDELVIWQRAIYTPDGVPYAAAPPGVTIARLGPADAAALAAFAPEDAWIAKPWGGTTQLAAGGYCWGAWSDSRLVSVACTFHVGDSFEEIGVVTDSGYRRRGLSSACAFALCGDIIARGKQPSWSTSTDNLASRRVAEKLGFRLQRFDHLYLAGVQLP